MDASRGPGRISVIVSTYEWPRALGLVLSGYAVQDDNDFEVVIADDGSGPATARVVERVAGEAGLAAIHVWHPDRGFRKTEILNRAIEHASGEYLIFTDGDCVPRRDLVRTHRELARPGRFLSGGYVRLSPDVTERLDVADVGSGLAFRPEWLREQGQRLGRHGLRLMPGGLRARLLDLATPTRPTFNGMNSSVWRQDALAVDGFELDFRYGGLDREFGARLENLGLRGLQTRYRAAVLHLHHERPWRDETALARQSEWRAEVRRTGRVRARRGLTELDRGVECRIARFEPRSGPPTSASDA